MIDAGCDCRAYTPVTLARPLAAARLRRFARLARGRAPGPLGAPPIRATELV